MSDARLIKKMTLDSERRKERFAQAITAGCIQRRICGYLKFSNLNKYNFG